MNAIIGFAALAAAHVNQPDPGAGIPEQDFHLRPAPFSA